MKFRMTKKPKRRRILIETSGVIYKLHGHTLMIKAVEDAVGDGQVEVSNFVRMEYLRGVILNLLEFYFLISEEQNVSDALIAWSQKVMQDRKLKVVLFTISRWLTDHEDSQVKAKSQFRLGNFIIRLVRDFDDQFRGRIKDQLQCRLGQVTFPRQSFSEELLLEFYERFQLIRSSVPNCSLCEFKAKQIRTLNARHIDLHSNQQRQNFKKNKGYVAQAERIETMLASSDKLPKCRWCERLGDTVLILHAPDKALFVTADRAFDAFGQILKHDVKLLPSLAELKRSLAAST